MACHHVKWPVGLFQSVCVFAIIIDGAAVCVNHHNTDDDYNGSSSCCTSGNSGCTTTAIVCVLDLIGVCVCVCVCVCGLFSLPCSLTTVTIAAACTLVVGTFAILVYFSSPFRLVCILVTLTRSVPFYP